MAPLPTARNPRPSSHPVSAVRPGSSSSSRPGARAAHVRRARALRLAVVPLLLLATAAAVAAGVAGGTGPLRVTVFVVLLLGVGAAVASDADARTERRELLAERARLAAAFADAHDELVRAHVEETDQLSARLTGHLRHLRDHLSVASAALTTTRGEVAALAAELASLRVELARTIRARDALKADVDAYVAVETARIAREQEAVAVDHREAERVAAVSAAGSGEGTGAGVGAVVDLGSWERRAAG